MINVKDMESFEEIVERYMQFDKKTLAELLAIKELTNKQELLKPNRFEYDLDPNVVRPSRTAPFLPPNYGDWIITCMC